MGTKARPFYRIVVARSTAGRDGSFVEIIGTCNPVAQPKQIKLDAERALHWLMTGAQPTETVAFLLKQEGVLDKYFEARPGAQKKFKSLDKRTAATSKRSVMEPVSPRPAAQTETRPAEGEASTTVEKRAQVVEETAIPEAEAIVATDEPEEVTADLPVVEDPIVAEESEVSAVGAAELAEAESAPEEPKQETE